MSAIVEALWQGATAASWAEQIATILGLIAVWLTTRQSLWNFPIGLVQVVLIGSVFFDHRLYADTFLQAVYFVALAYGWWSWTHPRAARPQLPVSRLTRPQLLLLVGGGLLLTTIWSRLLVHLGDPMPWRDAFLATFGVLFQWLEARKKLEAWPGWVVLNLVALGVYGTLGLYWFVFLYSLYLLIAFVGWRRWLLSYRAEVPA